MFRTHKQNQKNKPSLVQTLRDWFGSLASVSPASKLSGALCCGVVRRLRLCNLNICIKIDAECRLTEMTLVMTSLPFARVFNVCLHSRSFHLRADWRKSDSSDDAEPQGDWNWNSNSRGEEASSPPVLISRLADRAPRRACSQASFSLTELCHEFYQNSVNSNSENFPQIESNIKITDQNIIRRRK